MKMCALLLILDCHCLLSEVKANFVYYSYPLHIFIWIGLCRYKKMVMMMVMVIVMMMVMMMAIEMERWRNPSNAAVEDHFGKAYKTGGEGAKS